MPWYAEREQFIALMNVYLAKSKKKTLQNPCFQAYIYPLDLFFFTKIKTNKQKETLFNEQQIKKVYQCENVKNQIIDNKTYTYTPKTARTLFYIDL